MERWRVHKFGGSSVADAACMERVASILEADPRRRLSVVLSACRGVTDALLGLVSAAEQQGADVSERLAAIRQRHVDIADTLLHADARREYIEQLDKDCADVHGSARDRSPDSVRARRRARPGCRVSARSGRRGCSRRISRRAAGGQARPLARCAGRDSGRVGRARVRRALAGIPGERPHGHPSPKPTRR